MATSGKALPAWSGSGIESRRSRSCALRRAIFTSSAKWPWSGGSACQKLSFQEILAHRTDSEFVFAAYTDQLREVHADNHGCLTKIKDEFTPENFGRWFYERVKEWSGAHPHGSAYVHVFR